MAGFCLTEAMEELVSWGGVYNVLGAMRLRGQTSDNGVCCCMSVYRHIYKSVVYQFKNNVLFYFKGRVCICVYFIVFMVQFVI